jgi:hypothetical protein
MVSKQYLLEYVECTGCMFYYEHEATPYDPPDRGCYRGEQGAEYLCSPLVEALDTFRDSILQDHYLDLTDEQLRCLKAAELWEVLGDE